MIQTRACCKTFLRKILARCARTLSACLPGSRFPGVLSAAAEQRLLRWRDASLPALYGIGACRLILRVLRILVACCTAPAAATGYAAAHSIAALSIFRSFDWQRLRRGTE